MHFIHFLIRPPDLNFPIHHQPCEQSCSKFSIAGDLIRQPSISRSATQKQDASEAGAGSSEVLVGGCRLMMRRRNHGLQRRDCERLDGGDLTQDRKQPVRGQECRMKLLYIEHNEEESGPAVELAMSQPTICMFIRFMTAFILQDFSGKIPQTGKYFHSLACCFTAEQIELTSWFQPSSVLKWRLVFVTFTTFALL